MAKHQRSDRALLIFDMVPRLVEGEGPDVIIGASELVRYIEGELRYFRERDRPVIHLLTEVPGEPPDPIIDALTPRTGESVWHKPAASAFFETPLEPFIHRNGVRRLTLVGIGTATSILLTAADAYARGLGVVLPEPCLCDRDPDDHAFAMHLMTDVWGPRGGGPNMEHTEPRRLSRPTESGA